MRSIFHLCCRLWRLCTYSPIPSSPGLPPHEAMLTSIHQDTKASTVPQTFVFFVFLFNGQ